VFEGYTDSNWMSNADKIYATSGNVFTLEVVLFYISYAMEPCPRHAAVAEPAPAHATALSLHYYKNDFTRHCPNINRDGHKTNRLKGYPVERI